MQRNVRLRNPAAMITLLTFGLMLSAQAAQQAPFDLGTTGRLIEVINPDGKPKRYLAALHLPPAKAEAVPAVAFVHGTKGVDSRYTFHRQAMLDAGIAVFELDFKTGVYQRVKDAPPSTVFQGAAFSALKTLRGLPEIDPTRIAFMGFSLGGNMALQLASEGVENRYMKGKPGFAAYVAFYPGCNWIYDRKKSQKWPTLCKKVKDTCRFEGEPTGRPIYILTAKKDAYGDGKYCAGLEQELNKRVPGIVKLKIYPGAYHGFDLKGLNTTSSDNYVTSGKFKYDEKSALDSRMEAVTFLKEVFGL